MDLVFTFARADLNFDFTQALPRLREMQTESVVAALGGVGLAGPRGLQGPAGAAGQDTDPGDFNLIFENQLI